MKNPKHNKLTKEEIKQRFHNKGLIIVDEDFDVKQITEKTHFKCVDSEGYLYYLDFNNISQKHTHRRFTKYNPYILYNMQHFIEQNGSNTKILTKSFIGQKNIKYKLRCGQCGKEFEKSYDQFMYKKHFNCYQCEYDKYGRKYSDEFIKEELLKNGYIQLENYKGNNDKMLCVDQEGYRVKIKYVDLKSNKTSYRFSPIFNAENYIYNINNYFKSKNINCKALYYDYKLYGEHLPTVYCECACGEIFHTNINAIRTQQQYRCQKCSSGISNIEYTVKRWLDSKHIDYIPQKTFEGCVGDYNNLKFDFYLPKYNLCIEVDGEQHDEIVTFGGKKHVKDSEEAFKKRQKYDAIKTQYCKDNNIGLLRIPEKYIDRNKTYKKILYDTLIKK